MTVPPALVAMHIEEQGRTTHRLWFPLFLLWPLLLALLLLGLVATLLIDAVRLATDGKYSYTRLLWAGLNAAGETRGTEVYVQGTTRSVALTLH